jgi:large repetitive protein
MAYDAAQGQMVLFGGAEFDLEFEVEGDVNDTWVYQWGYANLGSAHICGTQHTAHEVCSTSATLHFTIADEQVGSIQYLTQGTPNLDFKQSATAGTCTAKTYGSPGVSCTVNVTFTPTAAGERNGAVVFNSVTGAQLAMIPVYGVGLGPEASFSRASKTSLGGGFLDPQGVAVDGSRNIYVADTSNNAVEKIPAGCTSSSCMTTLGGGFSEPKSVAVDGGGNVYVADYGNSAVKEIPAGCTSESCVITVGSEFAGPTGVAVDGRFNIYVADSGNNAVKQMPPICRSANCVTALGGGFDHPSAVALDSDGDIYVADSGNAAVKKIPAGCAVAGCVVTRASGFTSDQGMAVDAAGDVYLAQSAATSILELPSGCTSALCARNVGDGFSEPTGVALDGGGNLYVANSGDATVYALNRAVPAAVSFNATTPGTTSADSPKTVTVENTGNAALTVTSLSFPADFSEGPSPSGTPCTTGGSLSPSATCIVSIDFSPFGSPFGLRSEFISLFDNAYENSGGTQQIPVSGEVAPPSQ